MGKCYEYDTVSVHGGDQELVAALNRLGAEGWQVVSMLPHPSVASRGALLMREIDMVDARVEARYWFLFGDEYDGHDILRLLNADSRHGVDAAIADPTLWLVVASYPSPRSTMLRRFSALVAKTTEELYDHLGEIKNDGGEVVVIYQNGQHTARTFRLDSANKLVVARSPAAKGA